MSIIREKIMKHKITLVYSLAREFEIEAETIEEAEQKVVDAFKESMNLYHPNGKIVSYYCLKEEL